MSRILLAAPLLLALVNPAPAAEVRLGPETPLTPVSSPVPAAFTQDSPAVASNGHDFFAVWRDQRRNPLAYPGRDLYGARIGRDGVALAPMGVRIAENAANAVIASAAGDYLVAYNGQDGVVTQRLDQNGTPLATPRVLAVDGLSSPVFLTSNGSNYLLIVAHNQYLGIATPLATAVLLDQDGAPLRTVASWSSTPIAAGVHGGTYFVVDYVWSGGSGSLTARPVLHTISDSGVVMDQALPEIFTGGYVPLQAALSPNAILITWLTGQPTQPVGFLLAGYDGRTIRSAVARSSDTQAWSSAIMASWDGSAFALVFGRQPSSLVALRVTEGGSLLDSTPFVLTAHGVSNSIAVSPPVFASADTLQIAVWPDTQFSLYADIVGRTFTSLAELAATPDRANLISWSGPAQTGAHVARAGAHEIAVWSELAGHLAVALDGVTFPIAPPTSFSGVGAGNGSFLVVWHDIDANFNWKVLAVRIAFDGRILDPTPIVLESRKVPPVTLSDIGVAFDGSTFLVTWSAVDVFTVRLSEEGTIRGSATFPIANIATTWTFTAAHSPQVAWTGNGFFLAYSIEHVNYSDSKFQPPSGIAGLHVDAGREPTPPATTLFDLIDKDITPMAMAVGAGRSTLVWPSGNEIIAAQATLDGLPVSASFGNVAQRSQACTRAPAIAWDGAEYVVAWTEGAVCNQSTVRAIRLDRFADPIDAAPFDVATNALSSVPSIVPTADGVVIAYSRNDAANGDAPRAFERSLARLPPSLPRRRVVTH